MLLRASDFKTDALGKYIEEVNFWKHSNEQFGSLKCGEFRDNVEILASQKGLRCRELVSIIISHKILVVLSPCILTQTHTHRHTHVVFQNAPNSHKVSCFFQFYEQ